MTELQSLHFKASEIRSQLASEDSPENETELLKSYGEIETEIRKRMILEDEPAKPEPVKVNSNGDIDESHTRNDHSETEYRHLVDRVNVGKIFDSAIAGRKSEGAEAELQKHLGLADHVIPLDAIRTEHRAVTPAPSNTGVNQMEIEQNVFPMAAHSHLMVPTPTVSVGEALYPDVATNATVGGPHTDSTSVSETTGSFATVTIEPARFQASFFYRRTDQAKFAGMSEALRENLSMALMDNLDRYILTQLHGNSGIDKLANPTATQSYTDLLNIFMYNRVEGEWVGSPADIAAVGNSDAYSLLASTYFTNSSLGSAIESINRQSMGFRVSAHIPDVASSRATSILRLGMRRDAVAPIWEGLSLIVDPYTRTKTGEIVITAVMLANFALLRTGGFYLAQTYHS